MQNADRIQNVDLVQNVDCRLQSGYKMQTENLKSFYVWYIITCHLTAYRASRNRFSAIPLHDYLHYCGIFLAHFLMKIDCNIISSRHRVFSLCARVGWCDVCTGFTDVIKLDVDVNECHHWIFNTRNIRETIDSFARGPHHHLLKRYVFILLTKMQTETKTVPSTWYTFDVSISHHIKGHVNP